MNLACLTRFWLSGWLNRAGRTPYQPTDTVTDCHRLQYGAHRVCALPPGEFGTARLRLSAELIAQNRISQQLLKPIHQLCATVDQHPGHLVDDRVGQPARRSVADR